MVGPNIDDVFDRLSRAKTAINDYQIILRTQKEYAELGSKLGDLLIFKDLAVLFNSLHADKSRGA